MILDKDRPEKIIYRSPSPILSPQFPNEQVDTIANVVFPTGIDQRNDIGQLTVLMSITAWRITESVSRGLTCRKCCLIKRCN
jgi:hypothetical protein